MTDMPARETDGISADLGEPSVGLETHVVPSVSCAGSGHPSFACLREALLTMLVIPGMDDWWEANGELIVWLIVNKDNDKYEIYKK